MKRCLGFLLCVAASGCAREEFTRKAAPQTVETRVVPRPEARAEAVEVADPEARLVEHERRLAEMLAEDPRGAVAWVLGLADKALAAVLMDQALPAWVEIDPRAAAAHVAGLPESDYRTMLAGELAAAWAAREPSVAAVWAAGLGDQEAREEALTAALGRVAESDPRGAAELALRATREGDRAAALERVVETWWAKDAAALEAWAGGLADGRERELVERLVAARREAEGRVAEER